MAVLDELSTDILRTMAAGDMISPNATRIAKALGRPVATVHARLKRLERAGIIKSYVPLIDYSKTGAELTAFVLVKLSPGNGANDFVKKLASAKEVAEIRDLVGNWSLLLRVRARDMNHYAEIKARLLEGRDEVRDITDLVSPRSFKREF